MASSDGDLMGLPISPYSGFAPPSEPADHAATIGHVIALLEGAQEWLDLLDASTAIAWNDIDLAIEHVRRLR